MQKHSLFLGALIIAMLGAMDASAVTIRSWDNANQRGGDLASGSFYTSFASTLTGRGHTVLPGISSFTAGNLAGVDAFFWGTSSHLLAPDEEAALAAFVNSGGLVILETNSADSEAAAANDAYLALGLGIRVLGTVGGNVGGLFENTVSRTTVGNYGDLRGQPFDGSLARDLDPTGHLLVGVNSDGARSWVEFTVGAGAVLGVGDPYGFDMFAGQPNNIGAYINFLEGTRVPDAGGSLALLGLGLLSLLGSARMIRR